MKHWSIGILFIIILVLPIFSYSQKSIEYDLALSKCRIDTFYVNDKVRVTNIHIQDIEGAQLPSLNCTTLDGAKIDDEYFRGKVSVIHFWFKGCEPCLEEIPGLNALTKHFKNQNVNFLAVGHEQTNIIAEFSKQHPLYFDQLADGKSIIDKIFKYKGAYPATFIVDKNLQIVRAFNSIVANRISKGRIKRKLSSIIDKEIRKK